MARFLSQQWIDEFNAAIDGVVLPLPGPEAGLAAAEGSFVVTEEVLGAPDGDLCVTLRADGGRLQLSRRSLADRSGVQLSGGRSRRRGRRDDRALLLRRGRALER